MVVVHWRALGSSSQPIIRRQNPRELQLHQVRTNPLRPQYDLSVCTIVSQSVKKLKKRPRNHRERRSAGAGNRQKSAFMLAGLARRRRFELSHIVPEAGMAAVIYARVWSYVCCV